MLAGSTLTLAAAIDAWTKRGDTPRAELIQNAIR